jgi:hypothetical protein
VKVLIATPAYGGVVDVAYCNSVLAMVQHFHASRPEISFRLHTISISMIWEARNIFASIVLADPAITHLLFVDADMGFKPSLIERMIAFDKPVTGVVYPMRNLDPEAYHSARARIADPNQARAAAIDYVASGGLISVKGERGPRYEIVDGFVRARFVGAGVMLIQRQVLETIKAKLPELWTESPGRLVRMSGLPHGGLLGCFNTLEGGGEDVAFCRRWTGELDGELWANVDEMVVHRGSETFVGHYMTKLRSLGVELDIKQAVRPAVGEPGK